MTSYLGSFFEWLYDIPMPNDERTVPMEVLALGLSRSGTESLKRALEILGYDPCYHGFQTTANKQHCKAWGKAGESKWHYNGQNPPLDAAFFDTILGKCRAVSDMPAAAFGPELIATYPEAKVILNYRDIEPWFQSVNNTVDAICRIPFPFWQFHKHGFWLYRGFISGVWNQFFYPGFQKNGRCVYREHYYKIKGATKPENLLEWKIGDGWEPLCEFLGKPIPDEPFPSGNEGSKWNENLHENMDTYHGKSQSRNIDSLLSLIMPSGTAMLLAAQLRALFSSNQRQKKD